MIVDYEENCGKSLSNSNASIIPLLK